jgi:hypothetical protein
MKRTGVIVTCQPLKGVRTGGYTPPPGPEADIKPILAGRVQRLARRLRLSPLQRIVRRQHVYSGCAAVVPNDRTLMVLRGYWRRKIVFTQPGPEAAPTVMEMILSSPPVEE